MIRSATYLRLAHGICAINLIVYASRNMSGDVEQSLGWIVFGLMYACMEVNVTQDQYRHVRTFCATLAIFVTGALAIS